MHEGRPLGTQEARGGTDARHGRPPHGDGVEEAQRASRREMSAVKAVEAMGTPMIKNGNQGRAESVEPHARA